MPNHTLYLLSKEGSPGRYVGNNNPSIVMHEPFQAIVTETSISYCCYPFRAPEGRGGLYLDRKAGMSVPHAGCMSALRLRLVESYLSALLAVASQSEPLTIAFLKRIMR